MALDYNQLLNAMLDQQLLAAQSAMGYGSWQQNALSTYGLYGIPGSVTPYYPPAPSRPRAAGDCQGCGAPDDGGYKCRYCRRVRL